MRGSHLRQFLTCFLLVGFASRDSCMSAQSPVELVLFGAGVGVRLPTVRAGPLPQFSVHLLAITLRVPRPPGDLR